jgi:AhpD family alkylhydroperoxidase
MSRLTPLTDEEWGELESEAVTGLLPRFRHNPSGAGAAVATMMHHPALTRAVLTFNFHLLLRSSLPARLRELAILRVAQRRGCAYELVHHRVMAAQVGLTEAEIDAATEGKATEALDAAVLTAVDELETSSNLTDATWAALGAHLDEQQRMDLVFTIGCYAMLAMAFNTFGIEPEQER